MTISSIHCGRKKRKNSRVSVLFLILVLSLFNTGVAFGEQHPSPQKLAQLITEGGYLVKGKDFSLSHRHSEKFLPASTLKIVTAIAAFDLLGPDFRFETHIYSDQEHNLYIKGYGDPFLTSEEILRLCVQLQHLGMKAIQNLYLDFSAFALRGKTVGSQHSSNPYDAPNSALAVNFNSLFIDKLTTGAVVSAEAQTPTLPLMQNVKKDRVKGRQRINIDMVRGSKQLSSSQQYAGELFMAQLKSAGIKVRGVFTTKTVPKGVLPILKYKNSKTLQEMVRECLHYSNNFIANQIFLYCGAHFSGYPATWRKSQDFIQSYLKKQLNIHTDHFSIYDGSGLSRKNKISATALVTVLERFLPYRKLLNVHNGVYVKSGTLSDVYCYAGYFPKSSSLFIPFAVLLNQQNNTRDAILEELKLQVVNHK